MNYEVYCVKDKVSGLFFVAPLLFVNENCAMRWFAAQYKKDGMRYDYSLYKVGSFNTVEGSLLPLFKFICDWTFDEVGENDEA